ncbi:MAG: CPBP family intramembrane metalloprotease [Christensenellaceae bacterium]|nr:CPBP family intramembrane metalloprotease [Christensenellaceae bacterium]
MSFQVVFALLAVLCHCAIEKQPLRALGFFGEKPLLQLGWAVALFALLSVLFVGLPVLLGQALGDMLPAKDSLLFAIPYKLLFVGFAEELLFRGYFLNSFMRLTGSKIAAVILSSLLFGLWHFILSGSIFQVLVTAIIGVLLALPRAYAKTCSIVSVSLAHGLYDALLNALSWMI